MGPALRDHFDKCLLHCGKQVDQLVDFITDKLDILGRLLGASKLMDMVLEDRQMVEQCVDDFFNGRYSFSQEG